MAVHGRRPANPTGITPRARNRRVPPPPPRREGRPTVDGCAVVALALAGGIVAGLGALGYGAVQAVQAML